MGRDHLSQRHFIKYDGDGKIVHHAPARDAPPGRAVPAGFFSLSQEEKNEKNRPPRVRVMRDPAGERAAADARAIVPTGTRRAGEAQCRGLAPHREGLLFLKSKGKKFVKIKCKIT